GQALLAGLNNPGLFNYVGAFSPAVLVGADFKTGFPQLNKEINKQVELIWIGIGKDDFLLSQNKQFKQLLETNDIKFDYQETEGAHTWMVWRRYLTEFVPKLFK
ncbi:MAG TPA: alpha/beta hydrolase-fold protein, partial [Daejeonella sp.]|nr:alpha/beta hydrolase-fold protein [Daejeonella sp.]